MTSKAKLSTEEAEDSVLLNDYRLPSEIINKILTDLPIKEAVRTSILSKQWRCTRHTIHEIVFDAKCLPLPTDHESRLNKLMRIVDSLLSVHVGSIKRFILLSDVPSCAAVDHRIIILCRKHLKEVVLQFSRSEPYSLPALLFNSSDLTASVLHCSVWC